MLTRLEFTMLICHVCSAHRLHACTCPCADSCTDAPAALPCRRARAEADIQCSSGAHVPPGRHWPSWRHGCQHHPLGRPSPWHGHAWGSNAPPAGAPPSACGCCCSTPSAALRLCSSPVPGAWPAGPRLPHPLTLPPAQEYVRPCTVSPSPLLGRCWMFARCDRVQSANDLSSTLPHVWVEMHVSYRAGINMQAPGLCSLVRCDL